MAQNLSSLMRGLLTLRTGLISHSAPSKCQNILTIRFYTVASVLSLTTSQYTHSYCTVTATRWYGLTKTATGEHSWSKNRRAKEAERGNEPAPSLGVCVCVGGEGGKPGIPSV